MSNPVVINPQELQPYLNSTNTLLVDLCAPDRYQQGHIPGAISLQYSQIVAAQEPVMGLVPNEAHLSALFTTLGLQQNTHVIAYDDEGNGKASRLLYTLHCMGHTNVSIVDGGLVAWLDDGNTAETTANQVKPSVYVAQLNDDVIADREWIQAHSSNEDVAMLDTRSAGEFSGAIVRAARGGHIPGAVNIEWTDAMDRSNGFRLKDDETLRKLFETQGITPDKQVVVYCQTHHRSAHTFMVLKHLGFERLKGYPGAWSDWGNQTDTAIDTE